MGTVSLNQYERVDSLLYTLGWMMRWDRRLWDRRWWDGRSWDDEMKLWYSTVNHLSSTIYQPSHSWSSLTSESIGKNKSDGPFQVRYEMRNEMVDEMVEKLRWDKWDEKIQLLSTIISSTIIISSSISFSLSLSFKILVLMIYHVVRMR